MIGLLRHLSVFLSPLLLTVLLLSQHSLNSQSKSLVFTHVTVIDASGSPAQSDMTVVITGDRITALGKTGRVRFMKG